MVQVLFAHLPKFEAHLSPESLLKGLPPSLQKAVTSLRPERRKWQRLLAYSMLGHLLHTWNYAPTFLGNIRITPFGKPVFEKGPYFTISHSGDLVVIAASETDQLGIDIEQIKPLSFREMAILFSPEDRYYFTTGNLEDFYWLWTRKESVVKADGRGTSLPFSQVHLTPLGAITTPPTQEWFLFSLPLAPDYCTSLCINTPNPAINISEYLPLSP